LIARGLFVLGGVQFTTDPLTYEQTWPRRYSTHATIGGKVTIEDFGRGAQDLVLHLADDGNFIDETCAAALDGLFAQRGMTFAFSDWYGTAGTAFIMAFELAESHLRGWYAYDMTLAVRTLTALRGAPYTGA